MFYGAKVMTCGEVREILSDLIDVRNGEIPPAGASRLSEPEVRADAESHLAACSECRAELAILESVGDVFAEFSVGELPAQHFSDYGKLTRERMARKERKITPLHAPRRWWKAGASMAAAACLAFAVLHFMPKKGIVKPPPEKQLATVSPRELKTGDLVRTPFKVSNVWRAGTRGYNEAMEYDPAKPNMLDKLQNDEGKSGYLFTGENVQAGESPLLGVILRTTRDEDQDLSKRGSLGLRVYAVVPNSVAYELGVLRRDVIIGINGMSVDSGSAADAAKFWAALNSLGKGAAFTLDILREDRTGTLCIRRTGVLGQPKAAF
ncbi:MAG TPA: PDZ domain-containing protein [Planctomycetota bacterium]|nr:PDZ domain-containing protein [Planctomycetota bacterium]